MGLRWRRGESSKGLQENQRDGGRMITTLRVAYKATVRDGSDDYCGVSLSEVSRLLSICDSTGKQVIWVW
jgi:hypothetical protein